MSSKRKVKTAAKKYHSLTSNTTSPCYTAQISSLLMLMDMQNDYPETGSSTEAMLTEWVIEAFIEKNNKLSGFYLN